MLASFFAYLFSWCQFGPKEETSFEDLPEEVTATIFRYLDSSSLLSAAAVNSEWNATCKRDIVLRKRIKKHLRNERKKRETAYIRPSTTVIINRQISTERVQPFAARNINVNIQRIDVPMQAPKIKKPVKNNVIKSAMSFHGNGTLKKPEGKKMKRLMKKIVNNKVHNIRV